MAKSQAAALTQIIDILIPMEDAERLRTVEAALTFLGTTGLAFAKPSNKGIAQPAQQDEGGSDTLDLPQAAKRWAGQYKISQEELAEVFHIDGGSVEVIASEMPGNQKKDQVVQAYLLTGIESFLATGQPTVDDEKARALCRKAACFDVTNHSKSVKGLKNAISGTKATGLTLTGPGLREAAELVKQLSNKGQQ